MMKSRKKIFAIVLSICLVAGCAERDHSASLQPEVGVTLKLAQRRAATLSDIKYKLNLTIPSSQDEPIAGRIDIGFAHTEVVYPLQLDFKEDDANVISVEANGSNVDAKIENEHIVIPTDSLIEGENRISIEFIVGDTSLNRNPDYLYTLFVPDRARTAFPLFDQPDLKATYELMLTVPEDWTAMSNASIASADKNGGNTTFHFSRSDLISSYLFSFVAGKFETIEREVNGRLLTMLHRETDVETVARNVDEIFTLHAASLKWLEDYTGIKYPYQKFGFALIPSFQYGGMEHVGAIQYRADSLFLDESPSDTRLLARAGLIAHETAHMWFGNLVTMEWFNDVWTKEVFANFMAAKIVNPSFPDIDHDLNFLVRHYPRAYSVDRTPGANPIRQKLPNLNEAGQMYGAIIYNKAPIMMRQLELIVGEEHFRAGMREYLSTFSFANSSWPALIEILNEKSDEDLIQWSEVWVNTSGRPWFEATAAEQELEMRQIDTAGSTRIWSQSFGITHTNGENGTVSRTSVTANAATVLLDNNKETLNSNTIFNSDGMGYGLFPADIDALQDWDSLRNVEKGSLLINLYESLLERGDIDANEYFGALQEIVALEQNQLLLNLALGQMSRIYWNILPSKSRAARAPEIEQILWQTMEIQTESSQKKIFFDAFADIAVSPQQIQKVFDIWSGTEVLDGLPISENDRIDLAQLLAIKMPEVSADIVARQIAMTENPDNQRKFAFLAPSLSAGESVRSDFFYSLVDESNREIESWVLNALDNIHHPLRAESSEQFILPSLELLAEIQRTGDIFFPKRWLDSTLRNYRTATAVNTVRTFLGEHPNYNVQLRMKVLQAADMMFRANSLANADLGSE